MIIVSGWVDVAVERREEGIARSIPLQEATRRDEPGCLAYVFAADPVVEGRIAVYEVWTDADVLQAHFAHANYRAMLELLSGLAISAMDVAKHDTARSAPVYRPDLVADAHWWG